ncbi:hypothetical protein AYO47_06195 [Planctomyces sp. SCGC AG-212-M04]|nr:hypothetical protein AYO47_06195 [Planctomyces sp. SCGC AG-212-M04]
MSELQWQRHVVQIEGSKHNSVSKRFAALVMESSGGLSRLLTSSWGAESFGDPIGVVHKYELIGSGLPVRLIASDEKSGAAVFEVEATLEPVPRSVLGADVAAGDQLKELQLPGGKETKEHVVRAINQEYQYRNADKQPANISGTIVLDGPLRSTVNNPGALFLKDGRLAAIRQNNAYDEQKVLRPYLVPTKAMLEAYARLSQPPLEPTGNSQPGEYRRPEIVAIAWALTNEERADAQLNPGRYQAWRPDGTMIDGDELKWLSSELSGLTLDEWSSPGRLSPLLLVFRIDERARSPQSINCELRVGGRMITAGGSTRISSRNLLTKSSIVPMVESLPEWPEDVDVLARVQTREALVLKTIEGTPEHPVQIAPGVRWFIDPSRGMQDDGRKRTPGLPAAVLEIDRKVADRMAPVSARVTTKDGKPLGEGYVTMADADGTVEIRVSRPLTADNPIASTTFVQTFYRTEVYDHIPIKLELKPKRAAVERIRPRVE